MLESTWVLDGETQTLNLDTTHLVQAEQSLNPLRLTHEVYFAPNIINNKNYTTCNVTLGCEDKCGMSKLR